MYHRVEDGSCDHCWHTSNVQHTVTNHRCETCCHCGMGRCISVSDGVIPDGHGPHHPWSYATFTVAADNVTFTNNDGHT